MGPGSACRGTLAITAALLLLSLGGCGKVPPSHYYTLESSLPAPPAPAVTTGVEIAVTRFRANQGLSQDRLMYRPGPYRVDFYEYHRWVDTPPDLVTQNLVSHLRRSGMFRSVTGTRGASRADYLLRGRVEHLEEVDSAGSVSARVGLSVELVEVKTRTRVWAGEGSHEAPVGERSVEGVVRALNECLRESLDQIVAGLATHFQQHASR